MKSNCQDIIIIFLTVRYSKKLAYANHITNKCASIGEKSGYCGVALFSKEKPISVKYGLNNSTFDTEGRIIMAEFPEFFLINVCKLLNKSLDIIPKFCLVSYKN